MLINGRTDLASEARELWRQSAGENTALPGVRAREERLKGQAVTAVEILDERGEKALGKGRGKYFTLALEPHFERGAQSFPQAAEAIGELIGRCGGLRPGGKYLIAALGNPDVTPDALGPLAASSIIVTRHLKEQSPEEFAAFGSTALCRTGVLGTTGLESAVQLKLLCRELQPDLVIAVDALAGADGERLCRSIQISSGGVAPGSGVGNDRAELNERSLGVPVTAIGMPTVIDAALLGGGTDLKAMFVTPRYIDSSVRSAARLIAYGINLALHPGLSLADIDMLIG